MKLYFSPGACSLSSHIIAREAGLPIDIEQVDLKAKTTKSGANYTQINPKGYVPALALDDGGMLTECATIAQYLADKAPASKLLPPAGSMDRYRAIEWLSFVASELHKGFGPLFNPNMPQPAKDIALQRLELRLGYLDGHLAANQYLMGAEHSAADSYCFTILNWTNFVKMDLGKWPNVKAYYDRMAQRPKVQEAMKAEGLGQ